jgi:hypothetical protein
MKKNVKPKPPKVTRHAEQIWECKIGAVPVEVLDKFGGGADGPMRAAVSAAFFTITGIEPEFIFSGWNATLNKYERENRRNKRGLDKW